MGLFGRKQKDDPVGALAALDSPAINGERRETQAERFARFEPGRRKFHGAISLWSPDWSEMTYSIVTKDTWGTVEQWEYEPRFDRQTGKYMPTRGGYAHCEDLPFHIYGRDSQIYYRP